MVPATGRMLRELMGTVGAQNVTVVGNSAGGGLSLAAAQWLREAGYPQPNALILICPGVNGTLNQCTEADAARDVMQDVPGMIEAFHMYAGDLDVTHRFVSPLNGNFDGLAPMLIFTGTHDLYHPDILTLANKASGAGVPVEMHVRNGLQHNYPLLRTPEGHAASLHAQLLALPFERTAKLPLRFRADMAWALLNWGYEQLGLRLAAETCLWRVPLLFHCPSFVLFNRHATRYEATFAGWHSARMKKAALACLEGPLRGAPLDVGCGPGLLLATLAVNYPELRLAGLDIAPEMIRVATERLRVRAEIKLGDAESLPWADASFDYVFCVDSFHHYPNPKRALSEFHGVLKPNGQVVIADPTAPLPVRGVLNSIVRLLRMGDMCMYHKRDLTNLFNFCRFQSIDWRPEGSWGFVASARAL